MLSPVPDSPSDATRLRDCPALQPSYLSTRDRGAGHFNPRPTPELSPNLGWRSFGMLADELDFVVGVDPHRDSHASPDGLESPSGRKQHHLRGSHPIDHLVAGLSLCDRRPIASQ
jgi:hypothetical protein